MTAWNPCSVHASQQTPCRECAIALRALAEAATPGDWFGLTFYGNRGEVVLRDRATDDAPPYVVATTPVPADAAFIAAANPTSVLALLDTIARVEDLAEIWEAADGESARAAASVLRKYLEPPS